jgi:hypothetical protein
MSVFALAVGTTIFGVQSGRATYSLRLANVTMADYGNYSCDATNERGKVCQPLFVIKQLLQYILVISWNTSAYCFTVSRDTRFSIDIVSPLGQTLQRC